MTYRQLTLEQRYLIYKLRKEGYSQKRIAELIRQEQLSPEACTSASDDKARDAAH
jgi:hypothetical protein